MQFSLNGQNGSCVPTGFETSDPQNSGSGLTHTSLPPVFKYYTAQTQKPITAGHSFSGCVSKSQRHTHTATDMHKDTNTLTPSETRPLLFQMEEHTQTRKLEGVHITCTIKPESLKVQTPSVENELEQFLPLPEAVSVSVWNLRKRLQVQKEQVVWTMHSDRQPIEPGGWRRKKRMAGQMQATRKTQ